jgi:hypothetical protein
MSSAAEKVSDGAPRRYPIVLKEGRLDQVFAIGWIVLAAGGLAWLAVSAPDAAWGLLPFIVLLAALLTLNLVWVYRSATIITADAIETQGLFTRRRLRKADIAGYRRTYQGRGFGPRLRLVPRAPDEPAVTVKTFGKDAVKQWLGAIPDVDEQARAASRKELLSDPGLGATAQEREAALKRLDVVQVAALVAGLAAGVVLWLWTRPHPALLWLCAGARGTRRRRGPKPRPW